MFLYFKLEWCQYIKNYKYYCIRYLIYIILHIYGCFGKPKWSKFLFYFPMLKDQFLTLCDKVCQWLVAGRWFSPSTPISRTNKTDRHYITEILLKVALSTITLTLLLLGKVHSHRTILENENYRYNMEQLVFKILEFQLCLISESSRSYFF